MLPKALKSCPKSNKSPNLVTLLTHLPTYLPSTHPMITFLCKNNGFVPVSLYQLHLFTQNCSDLMIPMIPFEPFVQTFNYYPLMLRKVLIATFYPSLTFLSSLSYCWSKKKKIGKPDDVFVNYQN